MSTTREVAERIARHNLDSERVSVIQFCDITDAIDKALQTEQRRTVKITKSAFTPAHTYASENADRYRAFDDGQRFVIKKIVAAIREGRPPE